MSISVVIPVCNAAHFVKKAVESALSQQEVAEILLVEDGSIDHSLSVCIEIEKENSSVRLFQHPGGKNLGTSASRNLGIKNASCELVAFLDADDWYLSNRFALAIEVLKKHPEADGVYEAIRSFFQSEESQMEWFRRNQSDMTTLRNYIHPGNLLPELIKHKGNFHLNGLLVRKRVFFRCGYFDENIRLVEDTHFCLRLAAVCILLPGNIQEPVAMRRLHAENTIVGPLWHNRHAHQYAMWLDLLKWSMGNPNISEEQRELFIYGYLRAVRNGRGDRRLCARALARIEGTAKVLKMHPNIILRGFFWRHIACSIGLNHVINF